jgi:hypothetical protein
MFAPGLLWVACLLQACPLFAAAATAAPDDVPGTCQDVVLPQDIRHTLERRFAAWKIQMARDLLPEARQAWALTTPLACPGIASGHFADSRAVAYALLLVPANRSVTGYLLVAFSAPPKQPFYSFKLLDQAEIGAGAAFILPVDVDRVFNRDLQKQLRPKAEEAVSLVHVDRKEAFQTIFFWKGDSYEHTQMNF